MKKIEIRNERLASAVRTNDAAAAFKTAVENGQTRLALDIFEDIFPTLINRIDVLEERLGIGNVEPAKVETKAEEPAVVEQPSLTKAAAKATKTVPKEQVATED